MQKESGAFLPKSLTTQVKS